MKVKKAVSGGGPVLSVIGAGSLAQCMRDCIVRADCDTSSEKLGLMRMASNVAVLLRACYFKITLKALILGEKHTRAVSTGTFCKYKTENCES